METESQEHSVDNVATLDFNVGVTTDSVTMAGSDSKLFHGNRMEKLRVAMDKTVEHVLSLWSHAVLKKHLLQHKSDEDRQTLKRLHAEMIEKLRSSIKDEIALMLEEEKIEQLLSDLEDLCVSSLSTSEWRPTGVPEDDVAAHMVHAQTCLLDKLKSVSAEVEVENDRLCNAVTERRRLIESLKSEAAENKKKLSQIADGWEEWTEKTYQSGH